MRKFGNLFTVIGILLAVAGAIFILQSNSILGPSSSFMYKKPDWSMNGFIILIVGLLVAIFSIAFGALKRKEQEK